MTDARQVTILSTRPSISVTAWLGADPPTVSGGYGGWDIVARPRRQALTHWKGHDPFQMELPILLDGFVNNSSVEARCTALERMARPPRVLDEPPLVKVIGQVPHTDLVWVIQTIRWGDVVRSTTGQRIRQACIVSLLRYIEHDRVQLAGAAARARQLATTASNSPTSGISAPHTVKKGETLASIAAAKLGDYKRAGEIAALNGIRDPKSIKVNQKLRLP